MLAVELEVGQFGEPEKCIGITVVIAQSYIIADVTQYKIILFVVPSSGNFGLVQIFIWCIAVQNIKIRNLCNQNFNLEWQSLTCHLCYVEIERWHCIGISSLWMTFQTLSSHISPAVIKDTNEAVSNVSQGSSMPRGKDAKFTPAKDIDQQVCLAALKNTKIVLKVLRPVMQIFTVQISHYT